MNNLTRHVPFFHLLLTTHTKQKQALLKSSSREQITALCEILLNILHKNIQTTNTEKKYMNKIKKAITSLLKKTVKLPTKQRLLTKNLKLVDIILNSALTHINNNGNKNSTEVYSDTDGEIQENE